jgi:hypothetical protein
VELGVSERQIKRYIAGDCRIPKLVTERVRRVRARKWPTRISAGMPLSQLSCAPLQIMRDLRR